jgi:hypothetical protein
MNLRTLIVLAALSSGCAAAQSGAPQADQVVPQIDGDWWRIASNPKLGALQGEHQQPVDFAIWQAADGTWQLWSCVRGTKCGGQSRLFYRWEGRQVTDKDWKPIGIAMRADKSLGEIEGGLQAPHVTFDNGVYRMVYGDFHRICMQSGKDGKTFERIKNERGEPALFEGPYDGTRDPMLLKIGNLWYCYYAGNKEKEKYPCAAFCRTSDDLVHWSEPVMVAAGGEAAKYSPVDCECPFVVEREGTFYLFRNLTYGPNNANAQFASRNPLAFGVGTDRCSIGVLPVAAPEIVLHKGQYYIAALEPGLDGIRVAKLKWVKKP